MPHLSLRNHPAHSTARSKPRGPKADKQKAASKGQAKGTPETASLSEFDGGTPRLESFGGHPQAGLGPRLSSFVSMDGDMARTQGHLCHETLSAQPHSHSLPSLKSLAAAKMFTNRLHRVSDGQLPVLVQADISMEEVARFTLAGAAMFATKREARWSHTGSKPPTELGEEMLSEQQNLDERILLLRAAQSDDPTFKKHITKNIACRLKQEAKTQSQESLSMQQKCLNIKKHLAEMTVMRRELSGLKSQVEVITDQVPMKDDSLKDLGHSRFARARRDELLLHENDEPIKHMPLEVEVSINIREHMQHTFTM